MPIYRCTPEEALAFPQWQWISLFAKALEGSDFSISSLRFSSRPSDPVALHLKRANCKFVATFCIRADGSTPKFTVPQASKQNAALFSSASKILFSVAEKEKGRLAIIRKVTMSPESAAHLLDNPWLSSIVLSSLSDTPVRVTDITMNEWRGAPLAYVGLRKAASGKSGPVCSAIVKIGKYGFCDHTVLGEKDPKSPQSLFFKELFASLRAVAEHTGKDQTIIDAADLPSQRNYFDNPWIQPIIRRINDRNGRLVSIAKSAGLVGGLPALTVELICPGEAGISGPFRASATCAPSVSGLPQDIIKAIDTDAPKHLQTICALKYRVVQQTLGLAVTV